MSSVPWTWGATEAECTAAYPCDRYPPQPYASLIRAVDVAAPAEVLFRWVCQLKVAPYSYDLVDNGGRRSPRQLTPGVDELTAGERFMVFKIVEYESGRHITAIGLPGPSRLFGPMAVTYAIGPGDGIDSSSRLICKLNVEASAGWKQVRRTSLAWGDLVMMRKQLLTLKSLAEAGGNPGLQTRTLH